MNNTKTWFKSGRGGKRTGAGRPATGRSTKVVRVPNDFPDSEQIIRIVEVIRDWKSASDNASNTRWQRLRELLADLSEEII
ncbi:hypothetical protein [Aphanothece sacrum]|uniref:hypothetical protein n=1 Tax=Aphanothece sacrum TaxID=1122 RepID=UPI000F612F1F|nr:hypothetical protein [Aphanothece sacrum]GBF86456.1 hypothetical protein AsFPU3_3527 [Aphanothece sacrum FPU3]